MVEFLKSHNSIEFWTLIVAIATFIVTLCSYIYVRRSDKKRIKSEIARKQAIIESFEKPYMLMGIDHTVADNVRIQKEILKTEIEKLRKEL